MLKVCAGAIALDMHVWKKPHTEYPCLQAEMLLDRGIHPLRIAEGYERACKVAIENLEQIADRFEFSESNIEPLVQTCMTTLSSKMQAPGQSSPCVLLHLKGHGLLSLTAIAGTCFCIGWAIVL